MKVLNGYAEVKIESLSKGDTYDVVLIAGDTSMVAKFYTTSLKHAADLEDCINRCAQIETR